MKNVKLAVIVLAFTITGCKNINKTESDNGQVVATDHQKADIRELKTKTGKIIFLKETHPDGASLSKVQIQTKGFVNDQILNVGNINPVIKTELDDLDNDGFEELYIFTQSAGSGSAGEFYVYASDKDEKLVGIKTPQEPDTTISKSKDYKGHDSFFISKDTLIREFPRFKPNDKNSKPTGGTERVYYQLNDNKIGILKIESNSAIVSGNAFIKKLQVLKRKLHLGNN